MKYITGHRVNVRTVRKLSEGEGFTLRNGKIVEYKTGWQVATKIGVKVSTAEEAMKWLRLFTNKWAKWQRYNVGIWYENGIYYVDCGNRIATKKEAIEQGRNANQTSIYSWSRKKEPVLYL